VATSLQLARSLPRATHTSRTDIDDLDLAGTYPVGRMLGRMLGEVSAEDFDAAQDWTLITSRKPDDLTAFGRAILEALS